MTAAALVLLVFLAWAVALRRAARRRIAADDYARALASLRRARRGVR